MPTPSFILGGEKGWPVKEGKLLGYAQDENGLYRPIPVNFTRNSKSWVNRNGTLVEKAANVPTIGGTGTGKLVLQPERENLFVQSFGNLNSLNGGDFVQNNTPSKYSNYLAGTLTFGAPNSNDGAKFSASGSLTGGVTYTLYAEARFKSGTGTGAFDFRIDTSGDGLLTSADFLPTDQWAVYSWTFTPTNGGTTSNQRIRPASCDNGDQIEIGAVGLVKGSYITEPIITDGAAVTRLKDDPSLINLENTTEYTVVFDFAELPVINNQQFFILNGAAGTIMTFRVWDRNGQLAIAPYFQQDATYAFGNATDANRVDNGVVCIRASGTNYSLFTAYNGSVTQQDVTASQQTLTSLSFLISDFNIILERGRVYNTALTDAECIDLAKKLI